jgi:hypothetical protein
MPPKTNDNSISSWETPQGSNDLANISRLGVRGTHSKVGVLSTWQMQQLKDSTQQVSKTSQPLRQKAPVFSDLKEKWHVINIRVQVRGEKLCRGFW